MFLTEKKQFLLHSVNSFYFYHFFILKKCITFIFYFHILASACASENFNILRNKQQNIKNNFLYKFSNNIVVIYLGPMSKFFDLSISFPTFSDHFSPTLTFKKTAIIFFFFHKRCWKQFLFLFFKNFNSFHLKLKIKWNERQEEKNYWSWVIAKLQFHV